MITVSINKTSIFKGQNLETLLEGYVSKPNKHINFDIYDTGNRNRELKLSSGTSLKKNDEGKYTASVSTKALKDGIYEVVAIRLISENPSEEPTQVKPEKRLLFQVFSLITVAISEIGILKQVTQKEHTNNRAFNHPFKIDDDNNSYSVFMFIKGVLISRHVRFDHFEMIPTRQGLDSKDSLDFVNSFIRENTKVQSYFEYSEQRREASRSGEPVVVLHFPYLKASTMEKALEYCEREADKLILALGVIRGAKGNVFENVVVDKITNKVTNFYRPTSYRGNLLAGDLTGETPSNIDRVFSALDKDTYLEFIARLYNEAKAEPSQDFKCVRYWQILEMLATKNNYPRVPLLDFDNTPLLDSGGKQRECSGSANIVFQLLKDHGYGSKGKTYDDVCLWVALRDAVAHYGKVSDFMQLRNSSRKQSLSTAILTNGSLDQQKLDFYLNNLGSIVNLLLQKIIAEK